jgi:hypothetical protein
LAADYEDFHDELRFRMDLTAIWTALGAAAGIALKSIWDRYWQRRDAFEHLKRTKKIELLDRQLSEFYWPVYLRLQKDNAVWRRILDTRSADELRQKIGNGIERNFILPNHEEIVALIESKIHLVRADKLLFDQLLGYIRHIAVYKALRSANVYEVHPIHLGEPWPEELFGAIENRVKELQKEYDTLLSL